MKRWLISVTNVMDFKDRLPRIKSLLTILKELELGTLKDAKTFVCGEEPLKVWSTAQASKIIAFCDGAGLEIKIKVVTIREITPEEYKRLEAG